uniref:NADH dehydrogenase subunit 5 n=1 Tax=Silvatares holzenthali TaxID=3026466 RepID=UPI0023D856E5|nr:NADH dehydrogenase subunit 5 [Silvatares holzenthali]WCR50263.1 NADH dehydrogenase subunit 5 [Silvatares holzenthali]
MNFLNMYFIMGSILFIFSLSFLIIGSYFYNFSMSFFFEYEFISLNSSEVVLVMLFDWMSVLFVGVVFFISSMVSFYSNSYMSSEVNKIRFLILVFMFILSMMMMIISPNLISILLGWDGLGLISYCLVIYYQNVNSYNAGMLTVLSNRIGDVGILMAIVWSLNYGSWNFLFYLDYMKSDYFFKLILFMVVIAALTKSAQIPFSAWLPAAMAAPTPVSALVHSSTLVTAGVYLMIRFSDLFYKTEFGSLLMFLGMLTMLMAGIGANFEFDLKKIIALSTLSQLGFMMMILGIGGQDLAFFHLLIHAFFKSLLFLCAGVLIHSFFNNQDIRKLGSIMKFMPLVSAYFNISNLALCGVPFLAGFYSKDLILENVLISQVSILSLFMCYFATGLTVSYSFRVLYWSFFSNLSGNNIFGYNDEDKIMNKSMFFLTLMSIVGGSVFMWMIVPSLKMIYLTNFLKKLIFLIMGMGFVFSYMFSFNYYFFMNSKVSVSVKSFLGTMWFLPSISTFGATLFFLQSGVLIKKNLDNGWLEEVIFLGVKKNLFQIMNFIQVFHLNYIKSYLIMFILWIFILVSLIVLL